VGNREREGDFSNLTGALSLRTGADKPGGRLCPDLLLVFVSGWKYVGWG